MNASIDSVLVAGTPDGPVGLVVLSVDERDDVLPISIGIEEAASIARGMDAADVGRPLTHDLLLDAVQELGGRLDRVVVSSLEDDTYIADLHLDTPRNDVVIDARPSDSLALASRTGAPIEVESCVFEDGRRPPDEFDGLQDIREVAEEA
jgi:bifunctional DNase/RNase